MTIVQWEIPIRSRAGLLGGKGSCGPATFDYVGTFSLDENLEQENGVADQGVN